MMLLLLLVVLLSALLAPHTVEGQLIGRSLHNEALAGSEQERYLRLLQLTGALPASPWSLRPLSPRQLDRLPVPDGAHPWNSIFTERSPAGGGWYVLPIGGEAIFNSAFPREQNNGAVWTGRGLTAAASGGVVFRGGPLTVALAPTLFVSQNASYDTGAVDADGRAVLQDPLFAPAVDRPMRFGEGPFGRLDPGQSTVRIDLPGLAVGLSSGNSVWGPADRYPLILGTNAPGFAHVFLGTSAPLSVGVGSVHGRVQWGALEQSDFSPMPAGSRRLMAGLIGVFQPAGLQGLEVGAGRFFHQRWPESGEWGSVLGSPFESIFKINLPRRALDTEDNQLASVFGRWVFARSGMEVYAEYAREDHNAHFRDFLLEPDHTSAYTFGFQKVWTGDDPTWWVLQGELLNATRTHLVRVRYHGPFYLHHALQQGHTHRGQVLGSPAAIGGAGTHLRLDRYDASGRWSAHLSREVQRDPITIEWNGENYPDRLDVLYSLGGERLLFRGQVQITAGAGVDYNLNRYLGPEDRVNLNASLGGQYAIGRW